jgi:2-polyprenyl-6-hydroxyphenyl methylase/3-demethylubiquinone-9 3-methyltransferase
MTDISIWGHAVPRAWLTQNEADYLMSLPQSLPTVEWVWAEMDRVWDQIGLDNSRPLTGQAIGEFYRHPVWLMNGIFTSLDPVSAAHREAIARYLDKKGERLVADYGGGFGELARAITRVVPGAEVSIIEPYPSRVGLERIQDEPRIKFVSDLSSGPYDAIVAQDVLEHVTDPVGLAGEIAGTVREGGIVVFANCFYPFIECHLPSTFHLRQTFPVVMKALGMRYLGRVDGASHAQVFERTGRLDLRRARRAERISRILGPLLNAAREAMSRTKRLVAR